MAEYKRIKFQKAMTDKEKILKAINQKQQEIWSTDTGEMTPATVPNNLEQGWLNALKWMENLINSLPAGQQPSEDLEKASYHAAMELMNNTNFTPKTILGQFISMLQGLFKSGAQWQKEQTINKACEWLNKNVVEYHPRKGELRPIVNSNAFREAMEKENE